MKGVGLRDEAHEAGRETLPADSDLVLTVDVESQECRSECPNLPS